MKFISFISTISLLAFLILNAHQAEAQTEKGTLLVGGTGYFTISENQYRFSLNPDGGLFLSDNLALGVSIPLYYNYITRSYDEFNDRYTNLGISPFVRYYFGEGHTRIFASGALGYNHRWNKYYSFSIDDYRRHSSGYAMGTAGVGVVHFITSQVGLEAIANYNRIYIENSSYGNFQLNLGFQIYLPSNR